MHEMGRIIYDFEFGMLNRIADFLAVGERRLAVPRPPNEERRHADTTCNLYEIFPHDFDKDISHRSRGKIITANRTVQFLANLPPIERKRRYEREHLAKPREHAEYKALERALACDASRSDEHNFLRRKYTRADTFDNDAAAKTMAYQSLRFNLYFFDERFDKPRVFNDIPRLLRSLRSAKARHVKPYNAIPRKFSSDRIKCVEIIPPAMQHQKNGARALVCIFNCQIIYNYPHIILPWAN